MLSKREKERSLKNSKQSCNLDIYYLNLKTGPLLLSSLDSSSDVEKIETISLHSSSNLLSEESRLFVESNLVHQASRAVSYYMQNKHYIPRLFISALVFLILYFFLSLVIRDPIPMVDEILISLGGTILTWVLLSKRDVHIALSSKLMLDISTAIHSLEVVEDDEVNHVEEYLYNLYNRFTIIELANILAKTKDANIPRFNSVLSEGLKTQFEYYLSKVDKTLGAYLKLVKKNVSSNEKLSALLVQSATAEGLSLEMLLFLAEVL